MDIACLDLEGVLVPEIWINVAEKTGIQELRRTTRDEPDYDKLMKFRLNILDENNITIHDIQNVIEKMGPLEGAVDFLNWLRDLYQVIILSDTFYDFAKPLMKQLGLPTLLCHRLQINNQGKVTDYILRQRDQKCQAVRAFKQLNFRVIACGDSYNDTSMLSEADVGILFCPPQNVIQDFPQFPVAENYQQARELFSDFVQK